jgi:hypothetical protein
MNIQLKKVAFYHRLSEETNAFNADVYIDGKKAATAENNGKGGETIIHFLNPEVRKQVTEYCNTLPPDTGNIPQTIDYIIDNLLVQYLQEKETTKQYKRWCKRETCFRLKGDKEHNYRIITNPYSPEVKQFLVKKYGDQIEEILNEKFLESAT